MKLKETDKQEFVARLDDSFEKKIKAAFIGGFTTGHDYRDLTGNNYPTSLVEEAYEWCKKEQSGK